MMVVTKFVVDGKLRDLFEALNCGAGGRTAVKLRQRRLILQMIGLAIDTQCST